MQLESGWWEAEEDDEVTAGRTAMPGGWEARHQTGCWATPGPALLPRQGRPAGLPGERSRQGGEGGQRLIPIGLPAATAVLVVDEWGDHTPPRVRGDHGSHPLQRRATRLAHRERACNSRVQVFERHRPTRRAAQGGRPQVGPSGPADMHRRKLHEKCGGLGASAEPTTVSSRSVFALPRPAPVAPAVVFFVHR